MREEMLPPAASGSGEAAGWAERGELAQLSLGFSSPVSRNSIAGGARCAGALRGGREKAFRSRLVDLRCG